MQRRHQRGAGVVALRHQRAHGHVGQRRIEGRHRLVGQQQRRPLVQRARDADALQLAARESVAALEQTVFQRQPCQRFMCPGDVRRPEQRGERSRRRPFAESPRQHGRHHAQPWRNRRRLVHGADARAQLAQGRRLQLPRVGFQRRDLPLDRTQRGAEHAQQRALARARRADDGQPFPRPRRQRNALQRTLAVRMHHTHARKRKAHAMPAEFPPLPRTGGGWGEGAPRMQRLT